MSGDSPLTNEPLLARSLHSRRDGVNGGIEDIAGLVANPHRSHLAVLAVDKAARGAERGTVSPRRSRICEQE